MARRSRDSDAFGHLAFLDVLANSIGALTFVFLMFFFITSGLVAPAQLRLLTGTLPDATSNSAYKYKLNAAGGSGPYHWKIHRGGLPDGLQVDQKSGIISGIPYENGIFKFTMRISDSRGVQQGIIDENMSIRVQARAGVLATDNTKVSLATQELPNPTVGRAYTVTLAAKGGSEPYSWSIVGALPNGLFLQGDRISGTPKSRGQWEFLTKVSDMNKAVSETRLKLEVDPEPLITEDSVEPLTVTSKLLPEAKVGKKYRLTLAAAGGVQPYTWSVASGALPVGLMIDPQRGVISGKPEQAGTQEFKVQVRDGQKMFLTKTKKLKIKTLHPEYAISPQAVALPWWSVFPALGGLVVLFILLSGLILGVQCPWDKSWRCKPVGKDPRGRIIYACKHGHRFVNEQKMLREKPDTNA